MTEQHRAAVATTTTDELREAIDAGDAMVVHVYWRVTPVPERRAWLAAHPEDEAALCRLLTQARARRVRDADGGYG